jgi:hypothetical protein
MNQNATIIYPGKKIYLLVALGGVSKKIALPFFC